MIEPTILRQQQNPRRQKVSRFLFVLIWSVILGLGCHSSQPHYVASPEEKHQDSLRHIKATALGDSSQQFLQNGCIILRRGNDAISGMFAQLNTHNQTFSHCGIVFKEDNHWMVFHSIGGEDNPDAKLRRETFEQFISLDHNQAFGICRYPVPDTTIQSLQQIVHEFYKQQIPFDMSFDLKTNQRFYCAEMVYKAFQQAMQQDHFFETTKLGGFEYVSTDNLFVHPQAQLSCHVEYP
jgi:hypothetical protein